MAKMPSMRTDGSEPEYSDDETTPLAHSDIYGGRYAHHLVNPSQFAGFFQTLYMARDH